MSKREYSSRPPTLSVPDDTTGLNLYMLLDRLIGWFLLYVLSVDKDSNSSMVVCCLCTIRIIISSAAFISVTVIGLMWGFLSAVGIRGSPNVRFLDAVFKFVCFYCFGIILQVGAAGFSTCLETY